MKKTKFNKKVVNSKKDFFGTLKGLKPFTKEDELVTHDDLFFDK